jgi:thioredoxin-related protein
LIIRYLRAFIYAHIVFFNFVAFAAQPIGESKLPELFTLPVFSLDDFSQQTLQPFYGQKLFILLFSENCVWCSKQYEVIKQFNKQCPAVTPIMMGVGLNKQALKKELRRHKNRIPGYLAPFELINALDSSVTPRLLIVDEQGSFTHNILGYISLNSLFSTVGSDFCSSS